MRLLKGPHLQTVDVEVLLGGKWLIVEGGTFGGGASVQLPVQPETQMAATVERTKKVREQQKCTFLFNSQVSAKGIMWLLYTPSSAHLQRVSVAFHKVRILPRPAVHLKLCQIMSELKYSKVSADFWDVFMELVKHKP